MDEDRDEFPKRRHGADEILGPDEHDAQTIQIKTCQEAFAVRGRYRRERQDRS